jgi:hypothetical protein
VTLPVVWTPEANEDLLEARAWYDNIRPELGERFALAVEATVEALAEHPVAIPCSLPKPSPCGSAAFPVWHTLRGARQSDCGDSLLPRQAQSEALAIPLSEILNG